MGKRGPKPKPTRLKMLEGNPGRRPLNGAEPRCDHPPICPDWLDTDAKEEWDRVVSVTPPGLLTGMDIATLAIYCQTWSIRKSAILDYEDGGRQSLVRGDRGDVTNPLLRVIRDQTEQLLKASSKLGFDPTGRAGLRLPEAPDQEDVPTTLLGHNESSTLSKH